MLVLSRKVGEEIIIEIPSGDVIKIMLCEVKRAKFSSSNNVARIGIQAPQHIKVHRREVYNAIIEGRGRKEEE